MELDPDDMRFVFQGASDREYRGHRQGATPWRIEMLEWRQ